MTQLNRIKELSNLIGYDLAPLNAQQQRVCLLAVDSAAEDSMESFDSEKECIQTYVLSMADQEGFEDEIKPLKIKYKIV